MKRYLVIQKAWQHPVNIHKICYSGDIVELEEKDAEKPLSEGRIKLNETIVNTVKEVFKPKKKNK